MSIRFFITLALWVSGLTCSLIAQPTDDPVVNATFLVLDLEEVGEGSAVRLRQIGEFNEVLIEQTSQQTLLAQQQGNYNMIEVQLSGDANLVTAQQEGNHNNYELHLEGTDNRLQVVQDGEYNNLIQDFKRVEGLQIDVQQTGNGNSLEMTESDAGPMVLPLRIEQTGGMQLIISNQTTPIIQQ
ncbi:MAG: hypothetical protein D6772_15255 [Bacteroidetes bacterium]|nr:MAG: hypothetical protein D6772_15255 [Bacteroidota bacterium]